MSRTMGSRIQAVIQAEASKAQLSDDGLSKIRERIQAIDGGFDMSHNLTDPDRLRHRSGLPVLALSLAAVLSLATLAVLLRSNETSTDPTNAPEVTTSDAIDPEPDPTGTTTTIDPLPENALAPPIIELPLAADISFVEGRLQTGLFGTPISVDLPEVTPHVSTPGELLLLEPFEDVFNYIGFGRASGFFAQPIDQRPTAGAIGETLDLDLLLSNTDLTVEADRDIEIDGVSARAVDIRLAPDAAVVPGGCGFPAVILCRPLVSLAPEVHERDSAFGRWTGWELEANTRLRLYVVDDSADRPLVMAFSSRSRFSERFFSETVPAIVASIEFGSPREFDADLIAADQPPSLSLAEAQDIAIGLVAAIESKDFRAYVESLGPVGYEVDPVRGRLSDPDLIANVWGRVDVQTVDSIAERAFPITGGYGFPVGIFEINGTAQFPLVVLVGRDVDGANVVSYPLALPAPAQ